MSSFEDGERLRIVDTAIVISRHRCWGSAASIIVARTLSSGDLLEFLYTGFCCRVSAVNLQMCEPVQ